MNKREPQENQQTPTRISSAERGVGLAFAVAVLVTLLVLVLNPRTMTSGTLAIVRFLAAVFAGISGYLFSGSLGLETKIPLNKTQIRATGAFAAFILVLFLFFVGVPTSDNPPDILPDSSDASVTPSDANVTSNEEVIKSEISSNIREHSEWLTLKPIAFKDDLIARFTCPQEITPSLLRAIECRKDNLSCGDVSLSLRFVAPAWNLDFTFITLEETTVEQVSDCLLTHFSLKDHISYKLQPFTPEAKCLWSDVWILTANGRAVDYDSLANENSEQQKANSLSLKAAAIGEDSLLRFKVGWESMCGDQTFINGSELDSEASKMPPELEV